LSVINNILDLLDGGRSTCIAVFWSLCIGLLFGIPLGVYLASPRYRLFGAYEVVAATRPLPMTVLIPVFITVFGLDGFAVPLIAVPVLANVAVNTATAIKSCSQRRRTLYLSWGVSGLTYTRHVLAFEVMESLAATMRIMVPYALAVHIALDYFLQTHEGLGAYVANAYQTYAGFDKMFGGIFVVLGIGLVLTVGLDNLLARSLRWKHDT
jgi:taurine transport system permease protein